MPGLLTTNTATILHHIFINIFIPYCSLRIIDIKSIKSLVKAKIGHYRGYNRIGEKLSALLHVTTVHIEDRISADHISLLIHTDHRHAGGYPVHRPYCAGVHIGLLQISHQLTAQGVISHRIEERGVPAQAPAGIRLVGPLPAAGLSEGAAQDGFAQLRGLPYSDHKVDVRASYHQNLFQ